MKLSETKRTLAYVFVSASALVLVAQVIRMLVTGSGYEVVHNYGIAFGFFSSSATVAFVLNTLAISAIIYIAIEMLASPTNILQRVAISMLLAGGFSNYFERLTLGYIVDYFEIRGVTVFNFADVLVDVAITILLTFALYEWVSRRKHNNSYD